MAAVHGLGTGDCILLPAPMAHISGLLNGVLLAVVGIRVCPMARWDAAEALELIERERVTFMIGPPAFFVSMLDDAWFHARSRRVAAPGVLRRRRASRRRSSARRRPPSPAA